MEELSFLAKVKEQEEDLKRAILRNKELKQKEETLIKERDKLNLITITTKIETADRNNNVLVLTNDLIKLKQAYAKTVKSLEVANEFIDSVLPILEKLTFKDEVVDCLQEKLLKSRLQAAEKEELVAALKNEHERLEEDLNSLKVEKPDSVHYLKQELLTIKYREAQVMNEFIEIKNILNNLKNQIAENQTDSLGNDSLRCASDSFIHNLKVSQEDSNDSTVLHQYEIDHLKLQIDKLSNYLEDMQRKNSFHERIRENLNETTKSIYLKTYDLNQKINTLQEKYSRLEEKYRTEKLKIQKSMESKENMIFELNQKFEELNKNIELHNMQNIKNPNETKELLQLKVSELERQINLTKYEKL